MPESRGHTTPAPREGAQRVIIEAVSPELDGGRFPIKRIVGDEVAVQADIFADGHDVLSAAVQFGRHQDGPWSQAQMTPLVNDRWQGHFLVDQIGIYYYTVIAWVDHFRTWRRDLQKKHAAGQDVSPELQLGSELLARNARLVPEAVRDALDKAASALQPGALPIAAQIEITLNPEITDIMAEWADKPHPSEYGVILRVAVDPPLAEFSAWYELFPRSCSPEPGRPGTLRDCAALLPRIERLGFDVLYLPPIHPIGTSFRKGRNHALSPEPDDPGSPWAIGSPEGGHKAIHPELGTMEDFRYLISEARRHKIEIALDIALQCSPDHPYVRDHPEWFRHRPDGSIQYAENPPKKYQDIYPLDFESPHWPALWRELKSIFEFWMTEGVRVFRVDNPHTKSFRFWEWCISDLKNQDPGLIFLSEAFTRPKVMYYLAKLGFTQSYNYFPWRNTRDEVTDYLTELVTSPVREFFRPSLWPNTPDILTEYLQVGGRPAFMTRLILAATLGASYGIYGPPFETVEHSPRDPGSEEYLNSEKFEIRYWNLDAPESLAQLICRVNRIRRENPALHRNTSLRFHPTDNPQLLAYSKTSRDGLNLILVVVNLDSRHTQRGFLQLPLADWNIAPGTTFQFHDLLTEARYLWTTGTAYVELNPAFVPAHILRLHRYLRTERDFDYFL